MEEDDTRVTKVTANQVQADELKVLRCELEYWQQRAGLAEEHLQDLVALGLPKQIEIKSGYYGPNRF